jgi:hypothetical protein
MDTKKATITFENLPHAVTLLINEVASLKAIITQPTLKSRIPVGIDKACLILGKARPTVYAMTQKHIIPCYKRGKKLYFYEDELLDFINGGKK